jgi:hypothetical protein
MRTSHAITALAAFTAGVTAAAALRRRAGSRPPVTPAVATPAVATPAVATTAVAMETSLPDPDGVVLPFARRLLAGPAPEPLESPARCGDSGGRTKAGAPCGVRTTGGGRCHHHPIAA